MKIEVCESFVATRILLSVQENNSTTGNTTRWWFQISAVNKYGTSFILTPTVFFCMFLSASTVFGRKIKATPTALHSGKLRTSTDQWQLAAIDSLVLWKKSQIISLWEALNTAWVKIITQTSFHLCYTGFSLLSYWIMPTNWADRWDKNPSLPRHILINI